MKKCKILGVKIGEHDSDTNGVVLDEVKFVPGAVNIAAGWASKKSALGNDDDSLILVE